MLQYMNLFVDVSPPLSLSFSLKSNKCMLNVSYFQSTVPLWKMSIVSSKSLVHQTNSWEFTICLDFQVAPFVSNWLACTLFPFRWNTLFGVFINYSFKMLIYSTKNKVIARERESQRWKITHTLIECEKMIEISLIIVRFPRASFHFIAFGNCSNLFIYQHSIHSLEKYIVYCYKYIMLHIYKHINI